MAESVPVLKAQALREKGYGVASVKGGPFPSVQTMDWHLMDRDGASVGLLLGEPTGALINDLAELRELLLVINALEHIKARFDSGYLEVPPAMIARLEKFLEAKP